ncbi:MAG TPA: SUMF1/EgtB/PvdO family nonheme iron enzyme [Planctomycetota bacterium]|nr:SUMF1/EgtB/PvdO family nonheme iron enzyme [Planctomycetota bacterium]
MTDPIDSAPPRRRIWPLAAMATLVGLLATYLIVQAHRAPDDAPEVVNAPPSTPPPTPPAPEPPEIDPADQLLRDAEAALKEGRWDDASKKAEQAKATRAEAAAALLARIEEARRRKLTAEEALAAEAEKKRQEEAAAKEKERKDREEALAELDRVESESREHETQRKWDAALAVFDAVLKKHPVLESVADYARARRRVEELRTAASQAFTLNAEKARAELKEGRYSSATRLARMASSFYPEHPGGAALIKEISTQMLESNLVPIPATIKGGVKLGDAKQPDEPERVFTSPGFLMDKYEVTNEEYLLFVQQAGRKPPPSPMWAGSDVRPGFERHPVTHVSVADAEAFAAWAGKRLPTEDEWEYAARWVDGRVFPWGSTEPGERKPMCQSIEASIAVERAPENKPVGSWPASASPFGIHDLAGSVWEWTATAHEGRRLLKGGSYLHRVGAARASNRLGEDADLQHPDVGFRCVKDRP